MFSFSTVWIIFILSACYHEMVAGSYQSGDYREYCVQYKKRNPELTGISSYKKAFEQLKSEKAFEKYGKNIELDKIQYQIGNTYYQLLLLEKN